MQQFSVDKDDDLRTVSTSSCTSQSLHLRACEPWGVGQLDQQVLGSCFDKIVCQFQAKL